MATFISDGATQKPNNPVYTIGKKFRKVHFRRAWDDVTTNDIIILADALTLDMRIHGIFSRDNVPAVAGATDVDVGLYKRDFNGDLVEVDTDILIDGADFSSSLGQGNLLRINTGLDREANIGDLLSLGSDAGYDKGLVLALTFNSDPSGTSIVDFEIEIEEATTN